MDNKKVRGWVYILTNRSFSHLIKIGFSLKDPNLRAEELNSTGLPHSFELAYEALTISPYLKEQTIHSVLRSEGHHESKEFFTCDVAYAIQVVRKVCEKDLISDEVYADVSDELDDDYLGSVLPNTFRNIDPDLRGTGGYRLGNDNSLILFKTQKRLSIEKQSRLANGLFEYLLTDNTGTHSRLVFENQLETETLPLHDPFKHPYSANYKELPPINKRAVIEELKDILQVRQAYYALVKHPPPDRGKNELIKEYVSNLKLRMLLYVKD